MSELINNREHRQELLKEMITQLHGGMSVEEVKERYGHVIEGVSTEEISQMEQNLIAEGMPVEAIQRLCDVHASVFKGSIAQIHPSKKPEEMSGHPVEVMTRENREIQKLIESMIVPHLESLEAGDLRDVLELLREDFRDLWEIDKHYARKENLLFPYMEKYGVTAPPKVMWGVDDEIRALIRDVMKRLDEGGGDPEDLAEKIRETVDRVNEMIYKEENILFPLVLDLLTQDEWIDIERSGDEFGYALIELTQRWKPEKDVEEADWSKDFPDEDNLRFSSGLLNPGEVEGIFRALPMDITFVNKDGLVKYFSEDADRIFPRARTIIGRTVANCHPPHSVHIVEQIVEDLSSGKKDHEDFWIRMGERFVVIRYFAIRDEDGTFLGILEATQDAAPLRALRGEKRLLEDE